MLILHGSWMPAYTKYPARFALWGETTALAPAIAKRRGKAASAASAEAQPQDHPFAASADRLSVTLAALEAENEITALEQAPAVVRLPTLQGAPLPSPDLAADTIASPNAVPELTCWRVPARTVEAAGALGLLLALHEDRLPPETVLGSDLRFWTATARFALELLTRQRLLPTFEKEGEAYLARWRPALDDEYNPARLAALAGAMPPACRALTWDIAMPAPGPRALLLSFLNAVVDTMARHAERPGSTRRPRVEPARQDAASGHELKYGNRALSFRGNRGSVVEVLVHQGFITRGQIEAITGKYESVGKWVAWLSGTGSNAAAVTLPVRMETKDGESAMRLPKVTPHDWVAQKHAAVLQLVSRPAVKKSAAATAHGARSVGEAWLEALHGDPVVRGDPKQLAAFYDQYRAWSSSAPVAGAAESFRVCFRLDPPELAPAAEGVAAPRGEARDWMLAYLLQATDDPSLLVPAAEVWRQRGATARFLNRRFDGPQERLLTALGQAARLFRPIEGSLRAARPEACSLTAAEAHDFLSEKALLLRASGFAVLAPRLETRLSVRLRLGSKDQRREPAGPSFFGWDSVVEFDWQLALGDEPLTRREFEALAALKEPLVQVRGRWVELRPEQIAQALAFFQRQDGGGRMALSEALTLALAPDGRHGLPIAEVTTAGWMDELLQHLRNGVARQQLDDPPGLTGSLRPYQKTGVSWLATLRQYGLGACLADDMGLGKTIQMIALLLHERSAGNGAEPGPSLLICPTSVAGNWKRELERFAPSLRVLVHHGAERAREDFAAEAARHDVVISTYALLHRDESELANVAWDNVVLDEAQNIKNASTKAAQAARRLPARWKAALTGTPVENRLTDLWSIFQFLNPGYLGTAEDFRRRFANPIERAHDPEATTRLKALTAPFILRRLKSDRTIIQDLPEKNEMKVYCTLTREQATLYEAVVRDSLRQIEESEGIQRRGLILATLTKLKQISNHPALFLHDGSALEGRSGKLARLAEMLEEVVTVGDRALLFTQYAEMGKLLQEHLQTTLGREVLFLHGGTPAAARDQMVARFQAEGRGPQLFVLSIRAGGTGLNLTNANHVFHFDRWWNPAVENQATDRAFRIGQRRDVQVHKFLCAGTFEEVIDQIIERKVALAEAIVGAGENWITEMSTDELRNLLALRRDAVGAEG